MTAKSKTMREDHYNGLRNTMVSRQIGARGVEDTRVLEAMLKVPRHLFVPHNLRERAYDDSPLPIGDGQTISQPYMVAWMTELLEVKDADRILEVGTGSGYQAAILAEIARDVYSIEIVKPLADSAKARLEELGYLNVRVKHGDGYKGWLEYAPFDKIIVTAAPPDIPAALLNQLKVGGRMVVPVGSVSQDLYLITKTEDGIKKIKLIPVRFVPMTTSDNN